MGINYRKYLIHRLSAHLFLGFDLASPLLVCHSCDNPPCFNPGHLFLGTHADNISDKCLKERQQRGGRHGMAKLTESDVIEIRRLRKSGLLLMEIAGRFGVSRTTIQDIMSGRRWKHIL